MVKQYFILLLLCIGLKIQSHAAVLEGYVKDFMGVGVKNRPVYFCNSSHTSQLLQNGLFQSAIDGGKIIHTVKTNDEGLFRVEMDSCRYANVFLVFNNNICFSYYVKNFKLSQNPVVYINTEQFPSFEKLNGAEIKSFHHKKHVVVNAEGTIIEAGMISRKLIPYDGFYTTKEGDWKQFYDSGKIKMSCSYKKDVRNGPFIFYNEKGDVLLTIQYKENRIVSYSQSVNGRVKSFKIVGEFPHYTLLCIH